MISFKYFINTIILSIIILGFGCKNTHKNVDQVFPPHLKSYEKVYKENPRQASLDWFQDARFGMMICYGLVSVDARHEFEQWKYKIPVKEYEKKTERFIADKFDADFICDLAVEAEMKYITFVAKHCDGFCLWQTAETDFNSFNSPAYLDIVGELAEACRNRGLGLFIFYEHGFDWRHPHGPRRAAFPKGPRILEIDYPEPEPAYAYGEDYDLNKYVEYVHAQITELLTNYGPVAGVWLDGAAVPSSGNQTKFKLQELYDHIHKLQPHALISYKWGVNGTEDFFAPERGQINAIDENIANAKPTELCEALNSGWFYIKGSGRKNADWVMKRLEYAKSKKYNYLLNIGLLPDGSVHPKDIETLKSVGERIRSYQK
ncbi:MAG: alpha-L-fucosidase precursor [Draconibacterium sp.]|nr:alpha-L-fucosidase precursor [Draconibacterium sp.]